MGESKRFLLRLDPRLFEALRRWADDDLRSINAQIEYLLTDQARRAGRLPHQRRKPAGTDATAPEEHGESVGSPSASTSAADSRPTSVRR